MNNQSSDDDALLVTLAGYTGIFIAHSRRNSQSEFRFLQAGLFKNYG